MFDRLRNLFAPERRADPTLADPWLALLLGGSGPTASGEPVTIETAMRHPPVFTAVRTIAEPVGQLPIHVYERQADGGRVRVTDHPAARLLANPNDWTSGDTFRSDLTGNMAARGAGYAFLNRDPAGQVVEMIGLDPGTATVERDPATMEPVYRLNGEVVDRSRILHLRTFTLCGLEGMSPIMQCREAIGLSIVLERYAAGLFGRGARPAGVLKHPKAISEPVMTRLRASFEQLYRGGSNAGRVAILEDGVEFQALQLSSVDAQFLEMRIFQLREIARAFRLPATMMNDLERVTKSSAEELGQQFLVWTLAPYLRAWQNALNRVLFSPEERGRFYVEFLVDDLARADLAARMAAYATAIAHGILNPNEAREMENRQPYAGGAVFTRPQNVGPVANGQRPPADAGATP